MTFPVEFDYGSEEEFTQKLVIPLLNRLGFSVVLNYHGTMEFGKDLIVGEFDRFAHIRYYGIQVKYISSISLSDSHDLIRDCEQAFNNTFVHPHTGEEPMINTFYVINGGSISDQAKQNYFSSLRPKYGDNARLIDGKSLVQLDHSIATISLQQSKSVLTGLLLELQLNNNLVPQVCESLNKMINEEGAYPVQRGCAQAVSSFLQQPQSYLSRSIPLLQKYWQSINMFNHIVDSVGVPLSAGDYKKIRVEAAVGVGDSIIGTGNLIIKEVTTQLNKLGPLVSP